jgi:hypothetical protein
LSEKVQKWLFVNFCGETPHFGVLVRSRALTPQNADHSTGNPEELQKYPMKIYGEGL